MPNDRAEYYRQRAEQCRRLTRLILNQHDPIATGLIALSVEFEAKAAALSAQKTSSPPTDVIKDET